MLHEAAWEFLSSLEGWEIVYYFWPFFVFDFTRYVLLDVTLIPRYIWLRWRKDREWREARRRLFEERPLVSVIAPGKNEGKHIPRLAASLKRQTYRNIEIVIVDDGSDDDTPEICRRLLRDGVITRFIRNDVRGGKASAANTALRYSTGKYIVHLDADSHLSIDAVEQILLPFYMDPAVGGVGGDIRVHNVERSFATQLQTIEYMKSLSTGRTISSQLGILRIIAGAFGGFRRDVLERLGGWDVGPGLDGDLTVKLRKLGYRVVHQPRAACYTNVPDSFRKLAKQRYRWDRSMVRFRLRKHRDILLPSAGFNVLNFLSSAENIFFNLVLNVKWWIYIAQMIMCHPDTLGVVLVINYGLYTLTNTAEFLLALMLLGHTARRLDYKMALYVPLMPAYTGFFLRLVRTFAYLMEILHRASYTDRWNPWKVSRIARRENL
ncbi:MAG: glycosyltransferase family 2 protein [Gammaproteobacteria bacterium]